MYNSEVLEAVAGVCQESIHKACSSDQGFMELEEEFYGGLTPEREEVASAFIAKVTEIAYLSGMRDALFFKKELLEL